MKIIITLLTAMLFTSSGFAQIRLGSDIDGEATGDNSGRSVSISADGSIVAIGAYRNDGNVNDAGHIRVYKYQSGAWTQLGSDIDGEGNSDRSGYSVSISADGTIVAIGAYQNNGNGTYAGHVRVYKYQSGTWTQLGSDIDGEAARDQSGYSVSISADGTIVAIGAWCNDNNGSNSGHVRIYKYQSGAWTQLGSDIDGEAAGDASGSSVSISADGTIIAIGAINNDGNGSNSGHVRIYKYQSGAWTQLGSDINGEAAADNSGYSVSISADGTIIAIGAINNDGNGSNSGHVRIYKYQSGAWTQLGSDIDGEAAGDNSGYSVSISADGTIVAIGAYYNNGNGSHAGHVRVYKYQSGAWTQLGSGIDGEAAWDQSGISVSISANDTTVAIGADGNDGNGNDAGHVRVFRVANCTPDITTDSIVTCGSYTWKDGKTYTSSNTSAYLKLVNKNGCDSFVKLNLTILYPNEKLLPSICAVTVDSASGKNEIIWEKSGIKRAEMFNIYRENSSSQFVKIGMVDKDSFSTFIDTASNPSKQAYRYKITLTDSCQNETSIDSSATHKTIHLTSNIGVNGEVNLIWNLYEGKTYTAHEIMRSTNGGAYVKIGQVAAGNSSYSDINPPSGTLVYVITISSTACRPSRGIYNSIRSNPVFIRPTSVETINKRLLSINPNPAKDQITITCDASLIGRSYNIVNHLGQTVLKGKLLSDNTCVSLNGLSSGVYSIQINSQGMQSFKIVKE